MLLEAEGFMEEASKREKQEEKQTTTTTTNLVVLCQGPVIQGFNIRFSRMCNPSHLALSLSACLFITNNGLEQFDFVHQSFEVIEQSQRDTELDTAQSIRARLYSAMLKGTGKRGQREQVRPGYPRVKSSLLQPGGESQLLESSHVKEKEATETL